jgi:hypothetical protein
MMTINLILSRKFSILVFMMLGSMIFLLPVCLKAQNAPVTTIASVANAMSGQVSVPITVTGFTSIGAISLSFDYPASGLHFSHGVPNPSLPGFAIGDQDLGNGQHRISLGWFGMGTSLANGSTIMTVTFDYLGGNNPLEFYDNGPSCEYADASYNVLNDVPQSTYYINGIVCGGIGNPGPISGSSSVCVGQSGVSYSVAPIVNASGYNWTVPAGATITSGNNTNAIIVEFSTTALSGSVIVYGLNACGTGASSQLAVSVNPIPIANAGSDITIPYGTSTILHAVSGGTGSYGYHWEPEALLVNPNIQDPQTINLTASTVFTLLVTNQTSLCFNTDTVIVTITGGPLNINPTSIPTSICRGTTAQLFANAGGGSGSYTYIWSCMPAGNPPWTSVLANPVVSPDSSTIYQLTVSDGLNSVQGSTGLTVFQLPSATIYGGDTLCGEGNSTILSVVLTGVPPWSFYYSNGTSTWFIPAQNSSPYNIVAAEPGIYTILAMSDANCTGTTSGSAIVAVFPVPPTPTISINGSELFSSGCCGNQWYQDGIPIPGATSQIFQPLQTAHYFDIVTVNGCISDTSNTVYFLVDGIEQPDINDYFLEPNPAHNYVRIIPGTGAPDVDEVRIFSVSAKQVALYKIDSPNRKSEIGLNIQHLSPGLYFVTIYSKSTINVLKLMVI